MNIVDKAMELAFKAHFGHANKHDGEPYVCHLHRVWISIREDLREVKGISHLSLQATAWLHDVIEDTDVTFIDLYENFGPEVATAVDALSKRKGESNEEYYHRVSVNPIAKRVKLADLHDNFGRNHMIEDESTRLRMAEKYSLGVDILVRS